MAAAGTAMGAASMVLAIGGALDARSTAIKAARARKAAAEFEAQQMEQNAGQSIAAAQRQAFETERTGKYVASRALALAAASGGGASDPTVMNTIATLESETAYRKTLDLYQGEERARQLRLNAQATRMSGEIGAEASLAQGRSAMFQGFATAASIGSTLYGKYGRGGPSEYTYTGGTPTDPSYG